MEKHEWIEYDATSVYLKVYLKISNIGTSSGVCDDVYGLYLVCSQDYYQNVLNMIDMNKNLVSSISPLEFRTGFITYSVPKFADSLKLMIKNYTEESTKKFITESYFKTVTKKPNDQLELTIQEARILFSKENYTLALYYYLKAIAISSSKKNELNKNVSVCYEKIGDASNDSDSLQRALSYYKSSYNYDSRSDLKVKISTIYERLGDQDLLIGNLGSAESFFKFGYDMNSGNNSCKLKLAEVLEKIGDNYYKNGFINAAVEKYYESLNIFYNKKLNSKYENALNESPSK